MDHMIWTMIDFLMKQRSWRTSHESREFEMQSGHKCHFLLPLVSWNWGTRLPWLDSQSSTADGWTAANHQVPFGQHRVGKLATHYSLFAVMTWMPWSFSFELMDLIGSAQMVASHVGKRQSIVCETALVSNLINATLVNRNWYPSWIEG